jgi:hypothetical protein
MGNQKVVKSSREIFGTKWENGLILHPGTGSRAGLPADVASKGLIVHIFPGKFSGKMSSRRPTLRQIKFLNY